MKTRYEVCLDGVPLSAVGGQVWVTDIVELAPEEEVLTAARPGLDGAWVTGYRRTALEVRVRAEVHEERPERRAETLRRMARWCRGTVLTVSTRPGLRLRVRCTTPPSASAQAWTAGVMLGFTAWETPWWEDADECRAGLEGAAEGQAPLWLRGDVDAPLEAEAVHAGPAEEIIDRVTVRLGGQELAFTGLGMTVGETLRIGHDGAGRMTLTVTGTDSVRSVMDRRTAQSSDEILLRPGQNLLMLTADAACNWRVHARGRWL